MTSVKTHKLILGFKTALVVSLLAPFGAHAGGGSRPDGSGSSCGVNLSSSQIDSLMRRYVPNGSNGRGPAAAVYRVSSSGRVTQKLYEKNAHRAQAVASTQKMITAYTAYKTGGLSNRVTWSSLDQSYDVQGGRAVLRSDGSRPWVGRSIVAKDLMKTLITQSSNGAALAISRSGRAQSTRAFVADMNKYSYDLIGRETSYKTYWHNPAGLTDYSSSYKFGDPNRTQLSSADNMARIMGKLGTDSGFKRAMSGYGMSYYTRGMISKLGYTRAAGRTIVAYIPLPRCRDQGIGIALFGDSNRSQFQRFYDMLAQIRSRVGY